VRGCFSDFLQTGFSGMGTTIRGMLWKRRRIGWVSTTKLCIYFSDNFRRWWEFGSISNTLYHLLVLDILQSFREFAVPKQHWWTERFARNGAIDEEISYRTVIRWHRNMARNNHSRYDQRVEKNAFKKWTVQSTLTTTE
jgi:hypothetical protein